MPRPTHRSAGLTLVELLVALVIVALLAALGWRATDAMVQTLEVTGRHHRALQAWQTVVAQWRVDLDAAIWHQGETDASSWRVTPEGVQWIRRAAAPAPGWQVVAWGITDGGQRWSRWLSPPFIHQEEGRRLWESAPSRLREEGVRTLTISDWHMAHWHDGSWHLATGEAPGEAVRLVLRPAAGDLLQGDVVIDWVSPRVAGGKS